MKVKIEIDPALAEDEVVIRCRRMEEHILRLQQDIAKAEPEKNCISLQDAGTSYFVPLDEILFFETEGKHIQAHTASRLYLTEHKLYELEESLPGSFMRISKSTIVNLYLFHHKESGRIQRRSVLWDAKEGLCVPQLL